MRIKQLIVDTKIYSVSEDGGVWSHRGTKLKPYKTPNGYYYVAGPMVNGKNRRHAVHRLVARAFIDNPHNKPEVNHLDLDKANNIAPNLEWCTKTENNLHASENGAKGIPVVAIPVGGGAAVNYPSAGYAARVCGFDFSTIAKCCNGKRNHHKGFVWTWAH